jgi:hypothetical protein
LRISNRRVPAPSEPRIPPPPPEIERRLQFHREQWLLVPLMFVVPLLALLGVLGGTRERAAIDLGGITLTVEFAPRDHLEDWGRIEVTVVIRSPAPLLDARVEFTRDMLDRLWQPTFHPPLRRIDAGWYVVPLGEVPPGEARAVTLDYRSTDPGRLAGAVRVRSGDAALAELPLAVTVLP